MEQESGEEKTLCEIQFKIFNLVKGVIFQSNILENVNGWYVFGGIPKSSFKLLRNIVDFLVSTYQSSLHYMIQRCTVDGRQICDTLNYNYKFIIILPPKKNYNYTLKSKYNCLKDHVFEPYYFSVTLNNINQIRIIHGKMILWHKFINSNQPWLLEKLDAAKLPESLNQAALSLLYLYHPHYQQDSSVVIFYINEGFFYMLFHLIGNSGSLDTKIFILSG